MPKTIIAAFPSVVDAENAIEDLKTEGYDPKHMSVMVKDQGEALHVHDTTGADAAAGAVSGATTGGVIGGLAGLLVGIGALTIPGIGPFLAAGPLTAALGLTGAAATTVSGAATGALAGGLIGALMNIGLSEEDATAYETTIREGGVVVAVPAMNEEDAQVTQIMQDNHASQVRVINLNY